MTLHAPNLDDRRFQDLVDDAKRLVQRRCPEWTDHNVSDPGVTLIEVFAWMTDQLLYRLNRVPDRHYIKFLELMGIRLFPPTAATCAVTFWLAAPQPTPVTIPSGTEVATVRTETHPAIVFSTMNALEIATCTRIAVASAVAPDVVRNHRTELAGGAGFACFDAVPKAGDALLVGLSAAVPACALVLRMRCHIEGIGVDPENPPLVWEAWDGKGWAACRVERDETGGLNRGGDVVLHVPDSHAMSILAGERAGWVRARVVAPADGQPAYTASPHVEGLDAFTIGGTVAATNAVKIEGEILGESQGVAGERFGVQRRPVVAIPERAVLEVSTADGWQPWEQVDDFAASGPDDRHFMLDAVSGEVALGPAVRLGDDTLRQYGAVPPKGARIRLRSYWSGGGRSGNLAAGALSVVQTSIPYVERVQNAEAALGGVDGEDIDNAKVRGPLLLRTRNRAVTTADYEQLARDAAPEVARVHCLPPGDGETPGPVRVLIVPSVGDEGGAGRLQFEHLSPSETTLSTIAAHLDERRVLGARVLVQPPFYQGVTIVARLRAAPGSDPGRLEGDALDALYRYLHPLTGGADGTGWPFGRSVLVSEVYTVLQRVSTAGFVEEVLLFGADPVTGTRGPSTQRLDLKPEDLVFSFEHQVLVESS